MHHLLNRILTRAVLEDVRLTTTDKFVYLAIRSLPKSNVADYARRLNMPYQTLRRVIRRLEKYDWVYSYKDPKTKKVTVVPWMPVDVERQVCAEFRTLAETAPRKGEFRMKAVLSTFVDDNDFVDNHRFQWAVSPWTGQPLEFDRTFISSRVVIEFQGRQHFEVVSFAAGESDLVQQMARDRAKIVACERKGFVFVEIAASELSCETIFRKLDGVLPLIQPLKHRPLYQTLDEFCTSYAAWVRGEKAG